MSGESIGTEEARLIATIRLALPGVAVTAPPARIPKGFSAESWRVETSIGALVVKVLRRTVDGAKLHGQAEAVRLARAAAVPTAELLYFELAKGYDPLLDFVKLGMFVFEDWPAGVEPFMRAYRARVGSSARFAERLRVCFVLEQLVMLPNWVWQGKPQLAERSRAYLRDWLREVEPWWLHELRAITE